MESIMNFLADNYIWFFVAAGILCFALIGFIIESRKKQKNEFKGESIEKTESNTEIAPVANVETKTEPLEPINSINNETSLENTMVINDAPLTKEKEEEIIKPSGIEYYNGPIEMPINVPTPEPMPEPIVEVKEEQITNNNITPTIEPITPLEPITPIEPIVEPIVESTISYEQEIPNNNFNSNNIFDNSATIENINQNNNETPVETTIEKKETSDYNIFDNMN